MLKVIHIPGKRKISQRKGNPKCPVGVEETEKEVREGLMRKWGLNKDFKRQSGNHAALVWEKIISGTEQPEQRSCVGSRLHTGGRAETLGWQQCREQGGAQWQRRLEGQWGLDRSRPSRVLPGIWLPEGFGPEVVAWCDFCSSRLALAAAENRPDGKGDESKENG